MLTREQVNDCFDGNMPSGHGKSRYDIASAIEAMVRAECVPQWQPIETAPKDGRSLILLLTPSGFPQVAYSNTWWTAGFSVECKPTHWSHIPAAPGITTPTAKDKP